MHPGIAVDFGGTHIRAALFPSEHPQPTKRIKKEILAKQGPDHVVDRIIGAIEEVLPLDRGSISAELEDSGGLIGVIVSAREA